MITMDFIDGLPQSGKANCILVVVDKFTRYAHFLPLNHPFTAAKVARVYLDNVYKLHGLPKAIISDRDPVFTSKFWQELFHAIGSELNMSTPYHPQTDGRQNGSISVWKFFCDVSYMLAQVAGVSTCHSRNSGTIPVTIQHWICLLFKRCMAMNRDTGALKWRLLAKYQI